ncbi:MAG: response regulator [Candidatus Saccharibacteria bacterium]
MGFVCNYFFQTTKVLGVLINAERVHNNTFQEGVEFYYKYKSTNNIQLLDSAKEHIEKANQMAYQFGTIDKLLQLPKEEYIRTLFRVYNEAFNHDQSNAYLLASRAKLFLWVKNRQLNQAQEIAYKGYLLGEKIKQNILIREAEQIDTKSQVKNENQVMDADLSQMRIFYHDFAVNITSLNDFTFGLLVIGIFIIVTLMIVLVTSLSAIIFKSIENPIDEMVQKFRVIATGNLNTEISIDTDNEIGHLANSFREIQSGLIEVIAYTKKVAGGNYNASLAPRSKEDELSHALNQMVHQLKVSHEKSEQDSWFKSGINQLNEQLRGDQNIADISGHALSFMMEFLHSQLGSVHLYNSEYQFLKLISAVGFDQKKLKERIKLNEGITGRAALEKRLILLADISDSTYTTYSSSGEYHPKQVAVLPLIFNGNLVGVMELSSIQMYTDLEIEFLKNAAEIIAINLNSAINMVKTNELLQKTQDQASELQVQQEELRVANEELMEHTNVLTESEKRLQVQQEELRVANEELEERTRQLEIQKEDISVKNSELLKIKDELELKARQLQLSSQYKSEFLANMSHELRTPLNSLLILSNILSNNKSGNLTEDQVRSASIIHKSGSDLLVLINEILDLSKIEAGKMTIEMAEVRTLDIQEEILMNFTATAEDKKLRFEVEVSHQFPEKIITDRQRLMQIIKNLLSNAFKFTSRGSVTVGLIPTPGDFKSSIQALNTSNSCCIKISDTGVGIPADKMESIFEAFQQADGSISRKFGGTGLGLSISRELIKILGGEIQLESKMGEGSTFYIYLPTSPSTDDKPLETKPPVSEQALNGTNNLLVKPTEKQTKSIPFFIEDDRDSAKNEAIVLIIHPARKQAEKFLQQARAKNYKAIVAATIEDGMVLAENYHPLAIMLAQELVNDKDQQNYTRLKANPLVSKLPVHLISSIDYGGSLAEDSELKTLETFEFGDALKQLEPDGLSHSKKILVVEDDTVTRQLVKTLLSGLDIEIQEANNAEDAYELISIENFDCIILDLGLPDYSGKELLQKLKQNNISIPKIIVYTGEDLSKEDLKSLNTFTNTIILKGIKSDERLMDEVTLFLHQVARNNPGVKIKRPVEDTEGDVLFKGKRILVVDDDIRNVFALGKILEDKDIEVLEAENGQMAIDVLNENKEIDLILMDVMMPVMNGYEAIRIIRNTPEIKDIPIICLTAKAMKEDYENALKNGANDYLSKPLNEEKLFGMLKIWLYKK